MKHSLKLLLITLTFSSCGNPHISSLRPEQTPIQEPVVIQEECVDVSLAKDVQFFEESTFDRFLLLTKCHETNEEDLGQQQQNQHQTEGYEIEHRTETEMEKQNSLEGIFNDQRLEIQVVDDGLSFNDTDKAANDGLVWSFKSPISSWSVSHSSETPVRLRLFNCQKILLNTVVFEHHSRLGFISGHEDVCHVAVSTTEPDSFFSVNDVRIGK